MPNKHRKIPREGKIFRIFEDKKRKWRTEKWSFILKKSGDILCKGNISEIYDFIDKQWEKFGMRWLFKRLKIAQMDIIFIEGIKKKDGREENKIKKY